MNVQDPRNPTGLDFEDSWATSVTEQLEQSRKRAWIVAAVASTIALLLALAIVIMLPLKTVEPYTLLVDRQTGYVEALDPLDAQSVTADAALTRSFLAQYVIARESFDFDNLQQDYRKVALWSAGNARDRYLRSMDASNPTSPLAVYPHETRVETEIRSISSLSNDSAIVRFSTSQIDAGGRAVAPQHWAAIITFQFSAAEMSAQDRYTNPLGFQITRYRRDAETLPEDMAIQPVPEQRALATQGGVQ